MTKCNVITKFQKGDKVKLRKVPVNDGTRLQHGHVYTVVDRNGSNSGVYLEGFKDEHDWWNDNRFELVSPSTTPIPLYSEEQAVSFLKEKGYSVTPPPEPLKGKVWIYLYKDNSIGVMKNPATTKVDGRTLLAIVNWTEGDGV